MSLLNFKFINTPFLTLLTCCFYRVVSWTIQRSAMFFILFLCSFSKCFRNCTNSTIGSYHRMATVIQIACSGNLGISFCNYQFFLILAFLNKALLLLSISNPGSVVFTNVYVGTEIRSSVIKLFCRQEESASLQQITPHCGITGHPPALFIYGIFISLASTWPIQDMHC